MQLSNLVVLELNLLLQRRGELFLALDCLLQSFERFLLIRFQLFKVILLIFQFLLVHFDECLLVVELVKNDLVLLLMVI